jgi:hypothetical protein
MMTGELLREYHTPVNIVVMANICRGGGAESKEPTSSRRRTQYHFNKDMHSLLGKETTLSGNAECNVTFDQSANIPTVVHDDSGDTEDFTDRTVVADLSLKDSVAHSAMYSFIFEPNVSSNATLVRDEEIHKLTTALQNRQELIVTYDEQLNVVTKLLSTTQADLMAKEANITALLLDLKLSQEERFVVERESCLLSTALSTVREELAARYDEVGSLQQLLSAAQVISDECQASTGAILTELVQLRRESSSQNSVLQQLHDIVYCESETVNSGSDLDTTSNYSSADSASVRSDDSQYELVLRVSALQTHVLQSRHELAQMDADLTLAKEAEFSTRQESHLLTAVLSAAREELNQTQLELENMYQMMSSLTRKFNDNQFDSLNVMNELMQTKLQLQQTQQTVTPSMEAHLVNRPVESESDADNTGDFTCPNESSPDLAGSAVQSGPHRINTIVTEQVLRLTAVLADKEDEILNMRSELSSLRKMGNHSESQLECGSSTVGPPVRVLKDELLAMNAHLEIIQNQLQITTQQPGGCCIRCEELTAKQTAAECLLGETLVELRTCKKDIILKEDEIGRLNSLLHASSVEADDIHAETRAELRACKSDLLHKDDEVQRLDNMVHRLQFEVNEIIDEKCRQLSDELALKTAEVVDLVEQLEIIKLSMRDLSDAKNDLEVRAKRVAEDSEDALRHRYGEMERLVMDLDNTRQMLSMTYSENGKLSADLSTQAAEIMHLTNLLAAKSNVDLEELPPPPPPSSTPPPMAADRGAVDSLSLAQTLIPVALPVSSLRSRRGSRSTPVVSDATEALLAQCEPVYSSLSSSANAEVLSDLRQRHYESNIRRTSSDGDDGSPRVDDNMDTTASTASPLSPLQDIRQWQRETNLKRLQPGAGKK